MKPFIFSCIVIQCLLGLSSSSSFESLKFLKKVDRSGLSGCCTSETACKNLVHGLCDLELNHADCFWDFGDCLNHLDTSNPSGISNVYTPKTSEFLPSIQRGQRMLLDSNLTNSLARQLSEKETAEEVRWISENFYFSSLKYFKGVINTEESIVNFEYHGQATIINSSCKVFSVKLLKFSTLNLASITLNDSFVDSLNISTKGNDCEVSITMSVVGQLMISIRSCEKVEIGSLDIDMAPLLISAANSEKVLITNIFIKNSNYQGETIINLRNIHEFSINKMALTNVTMNDSVFLKLSSSNLNILDLELSKISLQSQLAQVVLKDHSSLQLNNSDLTSLTMDSFLFDAELSKISLKNSKINSKTTSINLSKSSFFLYNSSINCNGHKLVNNNQSFVSISNSTALNCLQDFEFTDQRVDICTSGPCLNPDAECENGYFKYNEVCWPCKDKTFAIHNKNRSDETCFECTLNMSCHNQVLSPAPGIWIFNQSIVEDADADAYYGVLRNCPNPGACVNNYSHDEGQNPYMFKEAKKDKSRYTTICKEGYEGNFCHSCSKNYTKSSLHKCSNCPDLCVNVMTIIALIVLFGLIAFLLIKTTINAAYESEQLHSIGFKVLVNYIQVILLCLQYKIAWPAGIKNITTLNTDTSQKSSEGESPRSSYFFSIKCLLEEYPNLTQLNEAETFYSRLYFAVFLPIFLLVASILVFFLLKCLRKVRDTRNITVILIVPFLLIYPTILTYTLSPIACLSILQGKPQTFDEKIDPSKVITSFLIENRDILCDSNHYKKSTFGFIWGVGVYGFGVPLFILYQIYKKRKNLYITDVKCKYGFLIGGYKHRMFFWEFVILLKKLIIVFITVIMQTSYSQSLQSICIISFVILFFVLQFYFRPYVCPQINDIENFASIAALITIMMGIIYTDSNRVGSRWGDWVILITIICVNFAFLCYWAKFISKELFTYVIRSSDCLKRNFDKRDGFDEDISKSFNRIKFSYMKESQKLYTQVDDPINAPINYLNDIRKMNELYKKIIGVKLEKYESNLEPNLEPDANKFQRRLSRFITQV